VSLRVREFIQLFRTHASGSKCHLRTLFARCVTAKEDRERMRRRRTYVVFMCMEVGSYMVRGEAGMTQWRTGSPLQYLIWRTRRAHPCCGNMCVHIYYRWREKQACVHDQKNWGINFDKKRIGGSPSADDTVESNRNEVPWQTGQKKTRCK
jgi:hypothetical protein